MIELKHKTHKKKSYHYNIMPHIREVPITVQKDREMKNVSFLTRIN